MSYRKIGGLHFVRLGRIRVSFCLARRVQRPAFEDFRLDPVLVADLERRLADR